MPKPKPRPPPVSPEAADLRALATALGYEARTSADSSGDHDHYVEQDLRLDELYDGYWDAMQGAFWLSAYFQLPEARRPSFATAYGDAIIAYNAATTDAKGYAMYVKALPKTARHSSTKRQALMRIGGEKILERSTAELEPLVRAAKKKR